MGRPAHRSREELLAVVEAQSAQLTAQSAQIEVLQSALAAAQAQIAELESRLASGGPPAGVSPRNAPEWVKPNRPPKPEGPPRERKKREENHARNLEKSTEEVVHSLERCPECNHLLADGWVARRRQVLDIPVAPYIVREHLVMGYRCGVCQKTHLAPCDLSDEVVGQRRISQRVMALVAYLRMECRLPLAGIQKLLEGLYGLRLSVGALSKLLQATAERGRAQYEALREELRASPVVHADETGWREDGVNGYLWAFLTPTLRWFVRARSRAHTVPLGVLGSDFAGFLVTDFYSGYTPLNCLKQRCWVHYLRDLKELEEKHPGQRQVRRWRAEIRGIYEQATAYRATQLAIPGPAPMSLRRERARVRLRFEKALHKLAAPHLADVTDPCHVLAKRIVQFRHEFFLFVEHPEVPPENNLAERAIRPMVMLRKVTGGTRSPRGSDTIAILRSLFATWTLRGRQPLDACRQLLAHPCS
jgi:transposase